jgi:hypothetical protein
MGRIEKDRKVRSVGTVGTKAFLALRAIDKPALSPVVAVLDGNKHALMSLAACRMDRVHAYARLHVSGRHVWVWRAGKTQHHDRLRAVVERVRNRARLV